MQYYPVYEDLGKYDLLSQKETTNIWQPQDDPNVKLIRQII